ncbi:unnamed protein product [Ilex paraguariensis]|uniref:C2H2-type domain-containing protein n=1 Tax=Ilex paraguariensis TaxID=185542 RepID=A0ABC8SDR9_9AQUA
MQVTFKIEDAMEVQVGEILKCHKCTLSFDEMDDLLHHQVTRHRRKRSKFGSSITDGVIIKDGKYECQFCHKRFNERHRYNGHVGAHVKNHVKNADASPGENVGMSVDLSSSDIPRREYFLQGSNGGESNIVTETFGAICDDEQNSDSRQGNFKSGSSSENFTGKKDHGPECLDHYEQHLQANRDQKASTEESGDKQDKDCMIDGKVGRVDDATDVVAAKSSICLDSEAVRFNNENNSNCETSGGTQVTAFVANGFNRCFSGQGISSESCLLSESLNDQISNVDNVTGVSTCTEEPNQEAVSESGLLTSNCKDKTCDGENVDDRNVITTINKINLDGNEFASNESTFGSGNGHAGLDENNVIGVKQHCSSEGHLLVPNEDELKLSDVDTVKQQRGFESSVLTPSNDKETCFEDNLNRGFPNLVGEHKVNGIFYLGSDECSGYARSNKDALTSLEEERQFQGCSIVPSPNAQPCVIKNHGNDVSTCPVEERRQVKSSESRLLSLSDYGQNCGVEDYLDKVSTRKMVGPDIDEVQTSRNSAQTIPFGSSHSALNADAVTSAKQDSCLEFCSLFPSGNEQTFSAEDNVTGAYSSAMNCSEREKSAGGSLGQSCIAESSYNANTLNRIYSTPLDDPKLDVVQNSRNHELSLTFGHRHTGIDADPASVGQERYLADSSFVSSGFKHTFGAQSSLNRINDSTLENPQQGRGSASDLRGFNDQTYGFENSFNMVYPGRVWEGPSVDEVGNPGHCKFSIGFGSSHAQPAGNVIGGGIWRFGEENGLPNGVANTSTPLLQSSSTFRNFDIISDKGDNGLFRVNEKYDRNMGFEGLSSGRTEPVEYSFFTTQNSDSLPEDSKVFAYGAEMEQGFDSSFWLGKDALMPNIGGRNQVTTICVWCRSEFYHEPVQSGTQTGEIGSMCPTCSAKISNQFNVF